MELKDKTGNGHCSNFNFQPFNITELYLKNGNQIFPLDGPFKPVMGATKEQSEFTREHFSLYGPCVGTSLKSDYSLWLDLDHWPTGFAFFKFNMTRSYSDISILGESYLDQRIPTSGLDLHVTFGTAVPEALSCLVFTSYVEALSISTNEQSVRNVELDYAL